MACADIGGSQVSAPTTNSADGSWLRRRPYPPERLNARTSDARCTASVAAATAGIFDQASNFAIISATGRFLGATGDFSNVGTVDSRNRPSQINFNSQCLINALAVPESATWTLTPVGFGAAGYSFASPWQFFVSQEAEIGSDSAIVTGAPSKMAGLHFFLANVLFPPIADIRPNVDNNILQTITWGTLTLIRRWNTLAPCYYGGDIQRPDGRNRRTKHGSSRCLAPNHRPHNGDSHARSCMA